MAALRKLPTVALLGSAIAIQCFGELSNHVQPTAPALRAIWNLLFSGGPVAESLFCAYPLIPWLSLMMMGWAFGRWLVTPRSPFKIAGLCACVGVGLFAAFLLVRGVDGYGNWNLHRDSNDILQWLHVAKYPPSLAYSCLELAIAFALLAIFFLAERSDAMNAAFSPLALFGSTAFFYYLLHVHLMAGAQAILDLDVHAEGLAKTWIGAALAIAILAGPCWFYRRYKSAHPDSWTRYI
jgi:uncharacterized membrane protein